MTSVIALDVGTKRIGVAAADTLVPIASPLTTILVEGNEIDSVRRLVTDRGAELVIVGYPRNQAGEATEQTAYAEAFGDKLRDFVTVTYQDESLTSVMAENRLKSSGRPYQKSDIDAEAAAIILQDYLELHHAA